MMSINDFKIVKGLGQGAFGKVFLGEMEGQKYAIKKLSKHFLIQRQKINSVIREKDILVKNISCQFLPAIKYSFTDEESLYIVMEYISGGTLAEFLSKQKRETGKAFERSIV